MAIATPLSSFICWTTRWSAKLWDQWSLLCQLLLIIYNVAFVKTLKIFFGCYLEIRLSRHMIHRTPHVLWILERTSVFQAFSSCPPVGCGAWNIHVRLAPWAQSTHGIIIISGGPAVVTWRARNSFANTFCTTWEHRSANQSDTLFSFVSSFSPSSFDRKRMAKFKLLGLNKSGMV